MRLQQADRGLELHAQNSDEQSEWNERTIRRYKDQCVEFTGSQLDWLAHADRETHARCGIVHTDDEWREIERHRAHRASRPKPEPEPALTPEEIADRNAATDFLQAQLAESLPEWVTPSPEVLGKSYTHLDRRTEDYRGGLTVRNKRLRDDADLIAKTAPDATCWRTVVHRTDIEVTGQPVKCSSWGCDHCAKVKTARLLAEFVERFASRESVYVVPLGDDDARRRFRYRIDKHRDRIGLDVGAFVVPVAGSGFLAVGTYRDKDADRHDLADAFDLLYVALDLRAEVARRVGTEVDKRRVSRPGLECVRDNAKGENSLPRTNADSTEDQRLVGMILRRVSASDLADSVTQLNGKRGGKAKKGGWSFRFETATDADAFIAYLERVHDLTTDDKLAENRADRSDRIAWENEQTRCFA
jgi:hypothetical protein